MRFAAAVRSFGCAGPARGFIDDRHPDTKSQPERIPPHLESGENLISQMASYLDVRTFSFRVVVCLADLFYSRKPRNLSAKPSPKTRIRTGRKVWMY